MEKDEVWWSDETIWEKRAELEKAAFDKEWELFKADEADVHDQSNNMAYNPARFDEPKLSDTQEALKWIDDVIEDLLSPHPSVFESLIEETAMVMELFGTEGTDSKIPKPGGTGKLLDLNHASELITNWRGAFADNLSKKFLLPMGNVTGNHGRIGRAANENVIAMQAIYIHVRNQLYDSMDTAINAIDAIVDDDGASLNMLLNLLTGAANMLAPFLPSGKGAELGMAVLTEALGHGKDAAGQEAEKETVPMGASHVNGVIENLKEALEKVKKNRTGDEDKVIEACQSSEEAVHDRLSEKNPQTGEYDPDLDPTVDPVIVPFMFIHDDSASADGLVPPSNR